MPTAEQLAHIEPTAGDGASVVKNDDGSAQTSWPDGTVRVDEADGTVMVTFPDFSVLNISSDGTRTLNDINGAPLDPVTGPPISGAPGEETPTPPPTTVEELTEFVEGISTIADLATAKGILRAFSVTATLDQQYGALSELASAFGEALEGELSPVGWFMQPLKMLLVVIKATRQKNAARPCGPGATPWSTTRWAWVARRSRHSLAAKGALIRMRSTSNGGTTPASKPRANSPMARTEPPCATG